MWSASNRKERRIMKHSEVKSIKIDKVEGELPHHVELAGSAPSVYGAGTTLSGALMRAFSVSGMFPNIRFPYYNEKELAKFIFWAFDGGENWQKAIGALEGEF